MLHGFIYSHPSIFVFVLFHLCCICNDDSGGDGGDDVMIPPSGRVGGAGRRVTSQPQQSTDWP